MPISLAYNLVTQRPASESCMEKLGYHYMKLTLIFGLDIFRLQAPERWHGLTLRGLRRPRAGSIIPSLQTPASFPLCLTSSIQVLCVGARTRARAAHGEVTQGGAVRVREQGTLLTYGHSDLLSSPLDTTN